MRPPAPQPGASCLRTAARDREDQALLPSRGTIVRSTTQQILSACCMPGPGVKDTATTQREKNPCSWGLGRGQVTVSKMCNMGGRQMSWAEMQPGVGVWSRAGLQCQGQREASLGRWHLSRDMQVRPGVS